MGRLFNLCRFVQCSGLTAQIGLALFVIGLLLPLLPVAFAEPRIHGLVGASDEREMVESDRHPWNAIGRLNKQGTGFCTATLIAPDEVLTAAHCLWNVRTRQYHQYESLFFVAGYSRGDHQAARRVVARRTGRCTDGLDTELPGPDCDVAILTLDRSIDDIEPLPLLEAAKSAGLRLTLAGYHQDRPHMLSVHRDCRLQRWIGADMFAHECDATFGASGAPILTESDGSFGIAGVHIGFLERSGAEKAQVRGIGVAWTLLLRED